MSIDGTKIGDLTDGVAPVDTDEFVVERAGGNVKLSSASLAAAYAGGGSSAPVNWCVVAISTAGHVLTPGDPSVRSYHYAQADLTIQQQSGSDFSVGAFQTHGAIFSAAGGIFQAMPIALLFADATLDGGATNQRYVTFNALAGTSDVSNPNNPANGFGVDGLIPVLTEDTNSDGVITYPSGPGYVQAGEPCFCNFAVYLIGGSGTDSIPLDSGLFELLIWQTGTLT